MTQFGPRWRAGRADPLGRDRDRERVERLHGRRATSGERAAAEVLAAGWQPGVDRRSTGAPGLGDSAPGIEGRRRSRMDRVRGMPILDERRDFAHPVEGDSAWSESYYFNATAR